MLGLSLSKQFYEEQVLPLFKKEIPSILPHLAIGLVGEGSECLGFDDMLSQDHDFGVSLCFWVPEKDLVSWKTPFTRVLDILPKKYANLDTRVLPETSQGRCGLMGIETFYARYIGLKKIPETWQEWRPIPEHFLATATNGSVFHDECKIFTQFRKALLAYYPEDIRLKKIAARCAIMAQAGQYNLIRSAKRKQHSNYLLCVARFAEAALSLAFLLNKKYMPFYKWASTAVQSLPTLGKETFACLEKLSVINPNHIQITIDIIEQHCLFISKILREQGLSSIHDSWLLAHASEIQSKISIPQLRALPEMAE